MLLIGLAIISKPFQWIEAGDKDKLSGVHILDTYKSDEDYIVFTQYLWLYSCISFSYVKHLFISDTNITIHFLYQIVHTQQIQNNRNTTINHMIIKINFTFFTVYFVLRVHMLKMFSKLLCCKIIWNIFSPVVMALTQYTIEVNCFTFDRYRLLIIYF